MSGKIKQGDTPTYHTVQFMGTNCSHSEENLLKLIKYGCWELNTICFHYIESFNWAKIIADVDVTIGNVNSISSFLPVSFSVRCIFLWFEWKIKYQISYEEAASNLWCFYFVNLAEGVCVCVCVCVHFCLKTLLLIKSFKFFISWVIDVFFWVYVRWES